MRKVIVGVVATMLATLPLAADVPEEGTETVQPQTFTPYTGKVTSNKVRLRLQPSLDGHILNELNRGELLLVTGEGDDFTVVAPPEGMHGYIYRRYVLDGVVDGGKVNVRLGPSLDDAIVTQVSSGDKVEGTISEENHKWLKIALPAHTKFYIANDYVEKVGSASYLAEVRQKEQTAQELLAAGYEAAFQELMRGFEDINLERATASLQKVVSDYTDVSDLATDAKIALDLTEELYLLKKVSFLEEKTGLGSASAVDVAAEELEYRNKLETLTAQLPEELRRPLNIVETLTLSNKVQEVVVTTERVQGQIYESPASSLEFYSPWQTVELTLFDQWSKHNPESSLKDYYSEETLNSKLLTGVLQPYDGPVKNKPGDFVLLNSRTNLPIAYLYSTKVDLRERIGQHLTLAASERPNNNFAFPAFHVLSVE